MKIAYNTKEGDTVTIEANTPQELVELYPKKLKPDMLSQLSTDFNVHELALYLYADLGFDVFEVIEKTDECKPIIVTVGIETPKSTKNHIK